MVMIIRLRRSFHWLLWLLLLLKFVDDWLTPLILLIIVVHPKVVVVGVVSTVIGILGRLMTTSIIVIPLI
jgi:hypothetical protein